MLSEIFKLMFKSIRIIYYNIRIFAPSLNAKYISKDYFIVFAISKKIILLIYSLSPLLHFTN